jgi:hypothetical protein
MASSRGNGEGAIYQRSSDSRWLGVITLGYASNGRRIRKTVSAKTRAEVARKLKELQRQFDDGIPLPDNTLTVAQLLKVGTAMCFDIRWRKLHPRTTRALPTATSFRSSDESWS